MNRRTGWVIAALLLFADAALAADAVKIVTPFAAGGPADMLARLLAQELNPRLAADVIVENRGGGGGIIGTEAVARAPADGKTLLVGSLGSHVISPHLHPGLSYDPAAAFTPVALIGSVPSVLVIAPQVKADTLAELVAVGKRTNLKYASAGPGTTMNISGEMLNAAAGIRATHVPYRGAGPAVNDLLGGHIDFLIADFPVLLPLITAKSVRALALFGNERSPMLADVPTTAELGFPEAVMENWYGVFAPAGLPRDIETKLGAAIVDALRSPSMRERLTAAGLRGSLDGAAFRTKLAADFTYWGAKIKTLGITGE
ncbi:MAG: Bug family tripartite tricarboxylate transporter substrate binding protein [Xanthobacteraceae bacterium]